MHPSCNRLVDARDGHLSGERVERSHAKIGMYTSQIESGNVGKR
jgi:hypothetical protein